MLKTIKTDSITSNNDSHGTFIILKRYDAHGILIR
jgi:hypothetical protein